MLLPNVEIVILIPERELNYKYGVPPWLRAVQLTRHLAY